MLYAKSCANLCEDGRCKLAHLLHSYGEVFSAGPTELDRTSLVQHDIMTTPGPPVKQPPRRMSREKQLAAEQQVQHGLDTVAAKPSSSSWAAPIVMAKKKDESLRICVDYRPLNERTIKDAYPLPRIQDTLYTLSTARFFSKLDLTSGYWQVEMTPMAWNVMPFGLFKRAGHLSKTYGPCVWPTMGDVLGVSRRHHSPGSRYHEMLDRLSRVFTRLRGANFKLNPSKYCLFREPS